MAAKGFIEIDVQDWTEIKERLAKLEADMEQMMCNHLKHCMEELHWIRERLSKGYRPPWTVVALITLLTSAGVGLLVAYGSHLLNSPG